MALDLSALQTSLGALKLQTSSAAAAQAISDAYSSYALKAQDAGGNLVASCNPLGFQAALSQGLTSFSGTAQTAAAALASAFSAFWQGAVFTTPGAPAPGISIGGTGVMVVANSSVVILVNSAPLEQSLTSLFSATDDSASNNLVVLAQALHVATTTNVSVLMTGLDATPPPTGPLPTTQIGLVF